MDEGYLQLKDIDIKDRELLSASIKSLSKDIEDDNFMLADVICGIRTNIGTINIVIERIQKIYNRHTLGVK